MHAQFVFCLLFATAMLQCTAPQRRTTTTSSTLPSLGHVCGGVRYWSDGSTGRTWQQAREHCRALGGELASIHSEAEQLCVNQVLAHVGSPMHGTWIGLSEGGQQEGSWQWSDGTRLNYTHWLAGEPNNDSQGPGDCAHAWTQNAFQWNDIPCSLTDVSFLCRLPL